MTTTMARLAEEASSSKNAFLVILSKQQALDIYPMRSPTATSDPLLQAVAGKSTLVAEMYHVSPKTVRDIWNRKTWAQVTRGLWTQEEVEDYALEQAQAKLPPAERQQLKSERRKRRGRPPGSKDSRPRRRRILASDGSEQLLPSEGVMYMTVNGKVQVRPIPQAPTVNDVPLPAICIGDINEERSKEERSAKPDTMMHAETCHTAPPAPEAAAALPAERTETLEAPAEHTETLEAEPESLHRHDEEPEEEPEEWCEGDEARPASPAARLHWTEPGDGGDDDDGAGISAASGCEDDWMAGWLPEGLLVPQTPPSGPSRAPQSWCSDKLMPAGPTPGFQNTAPAGSVFHLAESILSGGSHLCGDLEAPGMGVMLPDCDSADPYLLFLYEKCGVEAKHERFEAKPLEETEMWYFGA